MARRRSQKEVINLTYQPVMVPEDRLGEAYRVLADLLGSAAPASEEAEGLGFPEDFWLDPANVREHLVPRSDTIRGISKYLAARPGQEVTAEEVGNALNLPKPAWNSIAGANGAFGRYLANRGLDFPWEEHYNASDGRVRMMMDAETAAVIKQVL
jgi:hypothetical protein